MKKVFSLNLISYLRSKGFKDNGIGKDADSNKVYFIFDESEEVTKAIREYKKPDATVNLHEFIANFKEIKSKIYEHMKANN